MYPRSNSHHIRGTIINIIDTTVPMAKAAMKCFGFINCLFGIEL